MSEHRPHLRIALPTAALAVATVVALGFAYRDLLTFGTRYSVESGVEYWLLAPNDRAPLLVLGLTAWLAYRRYPRLRALPPGAGPSWLVWLLGALGFSILAWSVHVHAADLSALSLMAVSSALLIRGWGLAGLRAMWLPVAFLLFAIPIPAPLLVRILWDLRLLTADYTGWLLYMIGSPALVSGDQILRPEQAFQVIEGCSGLRSMETLTMLVVLLIDAFKRRGWHAGLLLLCAPLVALALNGVRVLTLVLNPHSEIVAIHSLQGIAILLVGLLVVYAIDGFLARVPKLAPQPHSEGQHISGGNRIPGPALLRIALVVAVGLATVRIATPVWTAPRPPRSLVEAIDRQLEEYEWEPIPTDNYFSGRVAFRESIHRRYSKPRAASGGNYGAGIEVFVGSADLRDRRTSILSPTNNRPGSGWTAREERMVRLSPQGPKVLELVLQKGHERSATYTWYVGSRGLAEETLRNFLGLERSAFGRAEPIIVARLTMPMTTGRSDAAQRRLQAMYDELTPVLSTQLAHAPAPGGDSPGT